MLSAGGNEYLISQRIETNVSYHNLSQTSLPTRGKPRCPATVINWPMKGGSGMDLDQVITNFLSQEKKTGNDVCTTDSINGGTLSLYAFYKY